MGGHIIQGERRGARGQLPADRLAAAAKPSTRPFKSAATATLLCSPSQTTWRFQLPFTSA